MKAYSSPQVVTLPNALKVIAAERPYGKTFAAVLTFRVGSYDDPAGIPGLAHFCEHLAFRGENIAIAENLASVGAYINALTAPEYTQFIAVGHVDHLEGALVCFSNVLQNLPLTENDIAAEREIFRHELADVAEPSHREAKRERFLRTILGDPNSRINNKKQLKGIRCLTRENVDAFIKSQYHPGNACLSIVAPISHDELIEDAKRLFSKPHSSELAIGKVNRRIDQNRQIAICVDPFS